MKTLVTRLFLGLSLLFTGCESQQVDLKTVAPSQTKTDNVNVYYKYTPPSSLRPSKGVTYGSAARECDAALLNPPTLFEPKGDAVKKTISTHPTFLFQLKSFSTKSLLFTLNEPGVVEPILEKELDRGISGVIAIKLPQELPGLKTGKQYTWKITTLCNEPRTYNPFFNAATIERILPTPSLKQKLAAATSDYKRAQLYDQFGIGYDTISTVYKAYTTNPKPPSNSKAFEDLLKKNLQTYPIMAESSNSKAFEDLLKKNFLVQ